MTKTTDTPGASATPDPDQPIALGRYVIDELLGTGGMAEIFRASVTGPERFAKWVVIKRVKPKYAEQQVFVRMFIDEARINAALDHANIVSVFDFGELDGHYYIAMEYVDGIDLQVAHVRHKERHGQPIPWEVSVLVIRDLLRGLDYAHNATDNSGAPLGVIHRDVNLVNVMLRRDGAVKLLDFGCAKASSAIRQSRTVVGVIKGKLGYMSPEQTQDKDLDARSDVFSVGIVLHELLTGRRLFWGESELDMLRAVQCKPIPDPRRYDPDLPESLAQVTLKGLARDRENRFASASDMADALETIVLEHRIPTSRVRDLMRDLMSADAPPEKRDVTPRQRKVTVVTWLNLPVQELAPPRMVSGELVSLEVDEPAITTDQRWAPSAAPADEPLAGDPPHTARSTADDASPTLKWSTDEIAEAAARQPESPSPLPDSGIGSASKALLVIIALFAVAAALVGIWVFWA
jgi:serine/threonine protein kinase, bacterial